MAKQQILRFKPAPRFEQGGGEPSERMEDRNIALYHEMILSYDANPAWIEFSERTGYSAFGERPRPTPGT
jgi:hypothetical protein